MTEEQIREKTKEKVAKVKALCKELQISLTAKQRLNPDMMIDTVVIFTDEENYPLITREPDVKEEQGIVVPENVQPENEVKSDVQTPDIQ